MIPMPTREAGRHEADRQCRCGDLSLRLNARLIPRMAYPMRIAIPSIQSVSQLDHKMISPEIVTPNGAMKPAMGSRYGRSASGKRLRNAPSDNGAPAYISTLALVISPTRDCQLGNGRKQMQPVTKAPIRSTHGTPRSLTHSNGVGT